MKVEKIKWIIGSFFFSQTLLATTTTIKDPVFDYQMVVNADGSINVDGSGGGGSVTQGTTPWIVNGSSYPQPVTGTFWQSVQPVSQSGSWAVSQSSTWNINNISGTVSLPTGASTAANQSTIITDLGTINTTLGSPFQTGGSIGNTSFAISGTLPAFASPPTVNLGTIGTAATAANQTTGNSSLSTIATNTTSIANNVNNAPTGRTPVALIRNVYSSTNVTTGAYVQLAASTSDQINYLDVFDSSGQTLALAIGGAGSEVNQFYIVPGGNGPVPLSIVSGSRISIIAISGTANSGELDITGYK